MIEFNTVQTFPKGKNQSTYYMEYPITLKTTYAKPRCLSGKVVHHTKTIYRK